MGKKRWFFSRKGDVDVSYIVWIGVAVLVLVVVGGMYILIKNKGVGILDYIKSIFLLRR